MRVRSLRLLATFLASTLVGPGLAPARAADEADPSGDWRVLQVAPFGEREIFVLGIERQGPKLDGSIKGAAASAVAVKKVEWSGGDVSVDMTIGGDDAALRATTDKEGQTRGTIKVQGQLIPVRLAKSGAKGGPPAEGPSRELIQGYLAARNDRDPKSKAQKLAALIEKEAPSLTWSMVYSDLLRAAGPAGLPEEEVRGYLERWASSARPYGAEYSAQVRTQAIKALSGHKPYAGLALTLADEAEKGLGPDASTETRAEIARGQADAAALLGKADVAASAEARLRKYEATLDEEYHKKVPPFQPEAAEGRKGKKGDRVVLLELFTGAQCPPCVAADVAFDALNQSYRPSEVVALQYHLHIPGPDPLTNADSVARAEYYPDIQGTPSAFFNGKSDAGGGGPMAMSRAKYDQYRQAIDAQLDQAKGATIDLRVDRRGDDIEITAVAQPGETKGDDAKEPSKLRLRLALVEEQVRYVGGNRLRFHHHVVRAMPGGVEGKALSGGRGKVQEKVNLSDVRKTLEAYLSNFAKEQAGFPGTLPPIPLETLSVVAFVQDDADKSVLHAVQAPVPDGKRPADAP